MSQRPQPLPDCAARPRIPTCAWCTRRFSASRRCRSSFACSTRSVAAETRVSRVRSGPSRSRGRRRAFGARRPRCDRGSRGGGGVGARAGSESAAENTGLEAVLVAPLSHGAVRNLDLAVVLVAVPVVVVGVTSRAALVAQRGRGPRGCNRARPRDGGLRERQEHTHTTRLRYGDDVRVRPRRAASACLCLAWPRRRRASRALRVLSATQ